MKNNAEGIQHIRAWRKGFNMVINEEFNIPKLVELHLDIRLIQEELEELKDAFRSNNLIEQLDALADIAFVVEQLFCRYGFIKELKEDCILEVTKSNFSKLCLTEEDAKKSVEYYKKEKDVDAYYRERPALIDDDFSCYVIYRKSDNKVLKGINFKDPDFSKIIEKYNLYNKNKK